jgi:hypothetical protein
MSPPSPWRHPAVVAHAQTLLRSFRRCTGRDLLPSEAHELDVSRQLFEAPFVVLSHGPGPDPLLAYANRAALDLFELDWESMLGLPSRLTAEETARAERAEQLGRAERDGYLEGYSGVRVSRGGQRFRIQNATIWTIRDSVEAPVGQAATFAEWVSLDR